MPAIAGIFSSRVSPAPGLLPPAPGRRAGALRLGGLVFVARKREILAAAMNVEMSFQHKPSQCA